MILKRGSSGTEVAKVQSLLGTVVVDGYYGAQTEQAVMEFQRKNNLKVDGICGPDTIAMLSPFQTRRSKRIITEIIVHCTATKEGQSVTVSQIDQWHRANGWKCIGYHYVVYLDGSIHNGRDVDQVGSHCAGHNSRSIGVVYVGGLDQNGKPKDTRTASQKVALETFLKQLRKIYPGATIKGHHDYNSGKACPCFDAAKEYKNI